MKDVRDTIKEKKIMMKDKKYIVLPDKLNRDIEKIELAFKVYEQQCEVPKLPIIETNTKQFHKQHFWDFISDLSKYNDLSVKQAIQKMVATKLSKDITYKQSFIYEPKSI